MEWAQRPYFCYGDPYFGRVPESSAVDVEGFSQFVAEKVASVRLNKYHRRAAGVVQPCATWRILAVFLAADD